MLQQQQRIGDKALLADSNHTLLNGEALSVRHPPEMKEIYNHEYLILESRLIFF
jgi:hypothetical protein